MRSRMDLNAQLGDPRPKQVDHVLSTVLQPDSIRVIVLDPTGKVNLGIQELIADPVTGDLRIITGFKGIQQLKGHFRIRTFDDAGKKRVMIGLKAYIEQGSSTDPTMWNCDNQISAMEVIP